MTTATTTEESGFSSDLEAAANVVLRFKDKEITRSRALNELDRIAFSRDLSLNGEGDSIYESVSHMYMMIDRSKRPK